MRRLVLAFALLLAFAASLTGCSRRDHGLPDFSDLVEENSFTLLSHPEGPYQELECLLEPWHQLQSKLRHSACEALPR